MKSSNDLIDYDIYSPEPEDPSGLPSTNLRIWQQGFKAAQKLYGSVAEADKACAQSAWRYVAAHFEDDGYGPKRKWDLHGQRDFIAIPDYFVSLGRVREIVAVTKAGLSVGGYDDSVELPHLLWCQRTREAWVIPGVSLETSQDRNHPEAGVYERWHRRDMRESLVGTLPAEVDMLCVGIGDSISYRSDKWGKPNPKTNLAESQEYYHMHSGNGVRVWVDNFEQPRFLCVRGGWLDLHDKGLIH